MWAKITQPADSYVYQIKVTLADISPPIWRRIQVTSDTKLGKLHRILQIIMGWYDYHLHEFIFDNIHYGQPDSMFEVKNENPEYEEMLVCLCVVTGT